MLEFRNRNQSFSNLKNSVKVSFAISTHLGTLNFYYFSKFLPFQEAEIDQINKIQSTLKSKNSSFKPSNIRSPKLISRKIQVTEKSLFSSIYLFIPQKIPATNRPHLAVLINGETRPAGPMSKAPASDIFDFSSRNSPQNKPENGRQVDS